MKTLKPLFHLLLICIAFHVGLAGAQNSQSYLNDTGSPSYSVTIPVENGFIDVSNGNLHLEFPMANHPQRGALKLNERLVYDSRIWNFLPFGSKGSYHWWPYNIPPVSPNDSASVASSHVAGGWRFMTGGEIGTISYQLTNVYSYSCDVDSGQSATNYTDSITWTDPNGTAHPSGALLQSSDNPCDGTYTQQVVGGLASDGSGYSVADDGSGNPLVIDASGTQVYPQVIDRFGNYWSSDASNNLIDDTGRTPVIVTQNGRVTYYDVLAPNGPIQNNGSRVRYTVTSAAVSVNTNFQQSDTYDWVSQGDLTPVQSIGLPDGSQYSFSYDSYGELQSVTLPTGGVVSYGYSNFLDSSNTENRWLTSRTLSGNPSMTFTPTVGTSCQNYSTGCKEYVNVHKPSGDETVYELTLVNGAWNTGLMSFSGAAPANPFQGTPGSNLLAQTSSTYQYSNACSGSGCTGGNYLTSSLATTMLPSTAQQSVVTQTQSTFDPTSGKITDTKTWDYSNQATSSVNPTTPPSSLPAREMKYAYSGFDLQSLTIIDGSGKQAGQTTYQYTSTATATSGVAQHGTQNAGGPYPYTVSRWLNGGNASTTTYTADDTGTIISVVDPNQNPATTISYQCANSLPLNVKNPLGQTTIFSYDCNSGQIINSVNPNDAANGRAGTTYGYEGVSGRLQSITLPDGGSTTYSYGAPGSVTSTTAAAPNPNIVTSVSLDAFGRSYQHVTGNTSTETTYDVNGRVNCTTNPHMSTPSSSDGSTCITAYDGLDRPLTAQTPDGNTSSWSYTVNSITTTDEVGNQIQRTSNALGQLTSVREFTGGSSLTTNYSYDGLGNVTGINQLGNGTEPSRTRSFRYDSLSRLVSENNPETGSTCYGHVQGSGCQSDGYDANGNLLVKTDARNIAVSYNYDALNRITSKIASDGSFNYSYGYDDPNKSNGIGRLTHASNNVNAAADYDYNAMGRVVARPVCVPTNCGYVFGGDGGYDLAGHLTDSHITTAADIRASYDGTGRVNGANYTPGGSSTAQTLISNFTYGPIGETEATLGNGLREQYAYDNRARVNAFSIEPSSSPQSGGSAPFGYIDSAWNANSQQQSIPQGGLLAARGWAVDSEDGAPISQVVLLIDGAPVGQATLGLSRPDVANAYNNPSWSNSGWTLTVPTTNLSLGNHVATARLYDSSGNSSVTDSSIQFTVTSDKPPTVHADSGAGAGATTVLQGGLLSVGGWAADPEDGSPVAKVQILVDGEVIGDASLGGNRPDVASGNNNPNWANSGWNFTGSVKDAGVGSHTLTVAAYDSAGNRSTDYAGTIQITVNSSSDTWNGYIDGATNSSGGNTIPVGGTLLAHGWAVEPGVSQGSPVSRVDVEVDGITIGSANLGDSRPDVANAYGRSDFNNSGWNFNGSLTGIAPGPHTVRARIYTHSGSSFAVYATQQIIVEGHMTGNSATGQPARYAYALGYAPNSNITTASDSVSGDWSYNYDSLNRLITAQSAKLGASWAYDSFGNRTSQSALAGSAPESSFTFNGGTNRIDQYCYDAAGNLLDTAPCGYQGVDNFAYDAEGKLISSGYGTTKYIYDAEGNRVAKQSNGQTTNVYFYDVAGHMTVETDGNGALLREEIYVNGRHIGTRQNGQIIYAHTNWLGTESARSDSNGNLCETLSSLPYGDGVQVSGSCDPSNKFFTGFERDQESGFDHAQYRQYASALGRWNSPDPYHGSMDLNHPQSLNRYNYVLNNPLEFTDPRGLDGGCSQVTAYDSDGNPLFSTAGSCATWSFFQIIADGFEDLGRDLAHLFGFGHATLKASRVPRPGAHNDSVMIVTDATGLLSAVRDLPRAGFIGASVSMYNDPSVPNVVLNGSGLLVPELSLPTAVIGAENDLVNFQVETVLQGVIEAIPAATMSDGYGHTIPNPAETDICQAAGGPC